MSSLWGHHRRAVHGRILSLLLATLAVGTAAHADGPKRLAVLEFELAQGVKIDRTYFSDLARGAVKKAAPQLFVMTRESTEALLQANGKTMSDCTGECEIEIGRKLGADYIISGRITQMGSRQILTVRLFSTADGGLLGDEEADGTSMEQLVDAAKEAVGRLIKPLGKNAEPHGAGPAATESRIGGEARDVALGSQDDVIVSFDSTPPGALVMLDGQLLCQATPCSKLIAAGAHEVSMQREGYDAQQARLAAKKGAAVKLSLGRISALVTVETTPPGLQVTIDGMPAGQSPLNARELASGGHEIVVDDPCWARDGERIVLKKSEERTVRIAPKERLAGLKVTAEDESGNALEAKVLIDGREAGTAPGAFKVSVCSKKIDLRAGELGFSEDAKLVEGQVQTIHAKLAHLGPVPGQATTEAKSGLEFVQLPGGALVGGNFPGTRVAPFSLGRTATTVAAYAKCVAAGACTEPNTSGNCNWNAGRENYPINCVDWTQADAFCRWIGGRLPKAEEREWAASGGERRDYPWGSEAPSNQLCWNGAGGKHPTTTCPVGAYPAGRSKQGLLDLAGNVWEWLDTDYHTDYGGGKEVRGGTWYGNFFATDFRASDRFGYVRSRRNFSIGFRCAQ